MIHHQFEVQILWRYVPLLVIVVTRYRAIASYVDLHRLVKFIQFAILFLIHPKTVLFIDFMTKTKKLGIDCTVTLLVIDCGLK
jgi:hypothetical protein